MGKIRDKIKKDDKIGLPQVKPLTHIVFSLRYLTTNKDHGLEYFGNNLRKSHTAYVALVSRFYQNNYRLLCKSDLNHGNLLHIIAFDFDYSAYSHGS